MVGIILYLVIGALAGFCSGLLGIGGGVIIVPLLLIVYKYQNISSTILMHLAAGTSLASIVIISISSFHSHLRLGENVFPLVKKMLPGVIVGTVFGAFLAHFLHTAILKTLFGVVLTLVSLRIIFSFNPKPHRVLPEKLKLFFSMFTVSGFSSLLGLAGGTIIIPFLLWCNIEIRRAIVASLACSFVIALIGSASYMISGYSESSLPAYSTGYVYWPAFLGIIIMTPIFTYLGSLVAHRVHILLLKRIFGCCLLLMAIKMLF